MTLILSLQSSHPALLIVTSVLAILVVTFLTKLYVARRFFFRLRQQGCVS